MPVKLLCVGLKMQLFIQMWSSKKRSEVEFKIRSQLHVNSTESHRNGSDCARRKYKDKGQDQEAHPEASGTQHLEVREATEQQSTLSSCQRHRRKTRRKTRRNMLTGDEAINRTECFQEVK